MTQRKCYYFFSGYYGVAAASDLLKSYGIPNSIERAPVNMRNSCSFALTVPEKDNDRTLQVMNMGKVHIINNFCN